MSVCVDWWVGRWVGGWLRECVSGWVAESELVHECVRVTDSVKGKNRYVFLYSAVSSPLDRSKRFTRLPPWQT